jgi:gliding motility-associated protein GldM
MAGGKLTPRQKMINMMYLVLTALLALNVSAEILNAFKTVNGSITRSNTMIDSKTDKVRALLMKEKDSDPEKVTELLKIADEVQSKSADVTKYIATLEAGLNKAESDADLEVGTKLLAEGKDGELIRTKLEQYKKDVTSLMTPYPLPTEIPVDVTPPKGEGGGEKMTWQMAYFHMVPKVAALTILNKFKNDVKNTESMCMDRLAKEAVTVDVKLDQFKPLLNAKSSYILMGDKYEATIGVGAFSSAVQPEITVNGSPLKVEPGTGMGKYTEDARSPGQHKLHVKVGLQGRKGMEYFEDDMEYTVGVPASAAVMLDKMNVVYIGVENPITVSSGAGDEKTSVVPNGGGITLSKAGPGKYIAKATTPDMKAGITVSVKDGKSSTFPIRVKRIPDPIPTLGGKLRGGNAQPGTIKAQTGIVPVLDNFDFEARFNVESYDMVFVSKGEIFRASTSGPLFSPQMLTFISRAKPKDVIYLEEIKVRGPDGSPRKIGQIVFTIQ